MRIEVTDDVSNAVREFSGGLFRLVHRIVGDREQAMDLTQDVLVKVLLKPGHLRDKTRLGPYLFRSAYNAALNLKRDLSRREAKTEWLRQELAPANPGRPDLLLESQETASRLGEALASLADRQKEALTLRFFGELTIADIATAMRISQASVRVHIARGLENLKKQLDSVPREE